MRFRIRNPDAETAEYERCENVYRSHLRQCRKAFTKDLWKFFGWDFFHDGDLKSIQIHGDLKTVAMRLNCPNIKRLKSDGAWEYVNVMFVCTFQTVSTLTVQYEVPEHAWDVRKSATLFLNGEINTSPALGRLGAVDDLDPDPRYSLLMRLMADNSIIWLELVFSHSEVVAEEPVAFALMESDPQFEVPTWSVDKGS